MSGRRKLLETFTAQSINKKDFKIVFSRASGPGGQNVNKVNSKVTIKCPAEQWRQVTWLSDDIHLRLKEKAKDFPFLTKSGGVTVSSDRTRSQAENLKDCFNKLAIAIKETAWTPPPTPESTQIKWHRLQQAANKRRLEDKRYSGEKKHSRSKLE